MKRAQSGRSLLLSAALLLAGVPAVRWWWQQSPAPQTDQAAMPQASPADTSGLLWPGDTASDETFSQNPQAYPAPRATTRGS
ncbi:hypothetical protein [Deinococcus sonorensis]|uniref:Uncharacterized protein n=2 Tax=Deinococcus sonorensis TaxID=309891 RepID=A0AAU7UEC5_9DEIO